METEEFNHGLRATRDDHRLTSEGEGPSPVEVRQVSHKVRPPAADRGGVTPESGAPAYGPLPRHWSLPMGPFSRRFRRVTVSATVFCATIVLLSSFAGLVRASGPGPIILLSGLSPVTAGVSQTKELNLTINGG